eukprot:scaffold23028_cov71-Phaeocystis_antarctica.AAC.1
MPGRCPRTSRCQHKSPPQRAAAMLALRRASARRAAAAGAPHPAPPRPQRVRRAARARRRACLPRRRVRRAPPAPVHRPRRRVGGAGTDKTGRRSLSACKWLVRFPSPDRDADPLVPACFRRGRQ